MIQRINKAGARKVTLKPCKICSHLGHTAFNCPKKPRKPLLAKKRMNPIGKVGKATMRSNKAFLDSIPDDELYCAYCVVVGVEQLLDRKDANAEHFLSRARHPELRLDKTNLVVSCKMHNKMKGSMDGPEFIAILQEGTEVA